MDSRIDLTLNRDFRNTKREMTTGREFIIANVQSTHLPFENQDNFYFDDYGNYQCDRCGDSILFNYNNDTLCGGCNSFLYEDNHIKAIFGNL